MLKFILLYLVGIGLLLIHLFNLVPLPYTLTSIVLLLAPWILSGWFLWNTPKGQRIFFINLIASVLVALAFYGVSASLSGNSKNWKANLAGIEMLWLLLFVWLIWGWALLLFAGIKKFKQP